MIPVCVFDTSEDMAIELLNKRRLLLWKHVFHSLEYPIRHSEGKKELVITFWTTLQPYICIDSCKICPSIVEASWVF